jgi:hypothetical protein
MNTTGGQTLRVCVEELSHSKESFDRTLQSATAFMQLPPTDHLNGSASVDGSAWSAVEEDIKKLDLHRHPSTHATSMQPAAREWLRYLVLKLDEEHFGGFLRHYVLLIGCAPLPNAPSSVSGKLTAQSQGGELLPEGGGRRLR